MALRLRLGVNWRRYDMVSTPCAHFGGGRNKWDLGRRICLQKSHNLQWPTVQSFSLSFLFFLFLDVNLLI